MSTRERDLLDRAEAYEAAHEPPEPTREELLEDLAETLDKLEARFPDGEPGDAWELLDYRMLKLQVGSIKSELSMRDLEGKSKQTVPALTVIEGGASWIHGGLDEEGGER